MRYQRGFTLMELLIVLFSVPLLVLVGYGVYLVFKILIKFAA